MADDKAKPFGVFADICPTEAEARLDLPPDFEGAAYLGRWHMPLQQRTLAHVFSDEVTAADLERAGWVREQDPGR